MTEGFHLEVTRRKVLTYVPSEKKLVRSRGPEGWCRGCIL